MLYPQQNDLRNTLDLCGLWEFRLDPEEVGEREGWFAGLQSPRLIAVPASWNEQFQDTRDYLGSAWYVRDAHMPRAWLGQRIYIRVGSANYTARLWLNGKVVGEHHGGHLPFVFDVTEQIRFGETNQVAIRVDNRLEPTRVPPGNVPGGPLETLMGPHPQTNFDFFPYAGLQRPVLLYSVPPTHLSDMTVVTQLDGADGLVQVRMTQNAKEGAGEVRLLGEGFAEGQRVKFAEGVAETAIKVPRVRPWSPDDPYLYKLEISLLTESEIIDRYSLDIGVRTIEVHDSELRLNGKPVFLRGFGKHEDFPVHGRGLNVPLLVKDYSLLKWVGANSFRTSHYPYAEEAMQMADREGILIIDEIPAVGLFFDDSEENIQERLHQCKQQVRELIARDKNHPSVIMWSVANEPLPPNLLGGTSAETAQEKNRSANQFLARLTELARSLDPTRLVTIAGMMGAPASWLASSDVIFVNRYWGWYANAGRLEEARFMLEAELDTLHDTLKKPIVISEFGADTVAGCHADPPEMWTEEYQVELLRMYLDVADSKPFVVGAHVWNFADFKTPQSIRRVGGMNLKGVFTRDRQPKMAAHFLRKRWRAE